MSKFRGCDDLLHTCLCCGGLLFVAIAKSLLVGPWILLFSCTVGLGIGVIHFFRNAPQLIWGLIVHQQLTWRMSLFLICLTPIPMALWWPFICGGAVVIGIGFGFIMPFITVFDDPECCQFDEIFRETWKFTEEWWKLGGEFERDLRRWYTEDQPPGTLPYDLNPSTLLRGMLLIVISLVFLVPLWTLCVVYKLLPGLAIFVSAFTKSVADDLRHKSKWTWLGCAPFVLCIFVLLPVPAVLFMVLEILHGIGISLVMPIVYYDQESFFHVLQIMPILIREFDKRTNRFVDQELNCDCTRTSLFENCCNWNYDQSQRDVINDLVVYGSHGAF